MTSIRKRPGWALALLGGAVLAIMAAARRSAEARGEGVGDDGLYRCHVEEDTACTIVRQTARGLVVVSYRPRAAVVDTGQGWAVLVTDAAGNTQTVRPGTVTIIPGAAGPLPEANAWPAPTAPPPWPAPAPALAPSGAPNNAPIVE